MKHSAAAEPDLGTLDCEIVACHKGAGAFSEDSVAVEEPLEIQVRGAGDAEFRTLSVTMRTPGHDEELAAGFLYNESVVSGVSDLRGVESWGPFRARPHTQNLCRVELGGASVDVGHLERHFFITSACGVCGRTGVSGLAACGRVDSDMRISAEWICGLPARLRAAQEGFGITGGVHAAGLFAGSGELRLLREDVGRHNAVDKVAGRLLLDGALPASGCVLMVSGRLSFELVQKAARMGVPVLCGVGAPTSLAVELARTAGLTLAGFLRGDRFNVYAGVERIAGISITGASISNLTMVSTG